MNEKGALLTADRLRELVHYDPLTGVFTRKVRTSNSVRVGEIAGGLNGHGYCQIYVAGRQYAAHRLAWLWMTDSWPAGQVDHIDLDKTNNRWCNLREASNSQNHANTRAYLNNSSGYKGVYRGSRSNICG